MKNFHIPVWKEAPFIRLLLPFIAGIIVYNYTGIQYELVYAVLLSSTALMLAFSFLTLQSQYKLNRLNGIFLNLLLTFAGCLFAINKDPFKDVPALDEAVINAGYFVATLEEQLLERKSSWKALSTLNIVNDKGKQQLPASQIILYIKKDAIVPSLKYGTRLTFKKKLQPITNFSSDATFDYRRYCALKNIHYQVFLKASDFAVMNETGTNRFRQFLFELQSRIIDILRKNITQTKECGLAEALLIGYKNDLDRSLVQAYSNTGVVHVVAISGLHLGLIFSILNYLCKPIKHSDRGRILRVVIILAGLWLFSLLAGGSPSVLRSAVMFSSIVIGEYFSKRSSIYNNLASSAFFLLCYDPYWLWDLGFILSYSALISIVLFMRPVYNMFILKNRILDNIWKLNAVTIGAQVLTMPVLLYYFKQFPNLFIITNFVAVPLSSIILVGELILCAIHFIQPVALLLGKLLLVLIKILNGTVEYIDSLPYSTTNGLSINFLQMIVLYLVIGLSWYMFRGKHNHGRNFHFK